MVINWDMAISFKFYVWFYVWLLILSIDIVKYDMYYAALRVVVKYFEELLT